MNTRMQVALLSGGRLHLNDGPIDLIIGADGDSASVRRAYAAATARFADVLDDLCRELPLLRSEMRSGAEAPSGAVARRMDAAVRPLSQHRFITRMAAVAGAVADEILASMTAAAALERAYVNNGGDIALHLSGAASYRIGLIDRPDAQNLMGAACLSAADDVRGVATSGRHGRSFSLGIADAVTVLACSAAAADASATLIANAVDLPGHPAVVRAPACDFDPQSDLGARLVTRDVGPLSSIESRTALDAGAMEAQRLLEIGAIRAAALRLGGESRIVGLLYSHVGGDRSAVDTDRPTRVHAMI